MASAVEQKALTNPSQIDPEQSSLAEEGARRPGQAKPLRFGFLKVESFSSLCKRKYSTKDSPTWDHVKVSFTDLPKSGTPCEVRMPCSCRHGWSASHSIIREDTHDPGSAKNLWGIELGMLLARNHLYVPWRLPSFVQTMTAVSMLVIHLSLSSCTNINSDSDVVRSLLNSNRKKAYSSSIIQS